MFEFRVSLAAQATMSFDVKDRFHAHPFWAARPPCHKRSPRIYRERVWTVTGCQPTITATPHISWVACWNKTPSFTLLRMHLAGMRVNETLPEAL